MSARRPTVRLLPQRMLPARALGLVGLFTAALVVATLSAPVAGGDAVRALVVLGVGAQALALLWTAQAPQVAAAVTILLGIGVAAAAGTLGPGLAPAAVFGLAYFTPPAVSRCGLLAVVLTAPVCLVSAGWPTVPIVVATAVAVWALGGLLRARAEEQVQSERASAEAQRALLAREVHDVVGHGLAAIIVQAGAATDAFDRDPAAARRALATIDEHARAALGEIRGVIAGAGDAHGLGDLTALIDSVRGAGVQPELVLPGDLSGIPDAIGAAVYRIVQESLTNTLKHSGADSVRVGITRDAGAVHVRIEDGPGASHRTDRPGPAADPPPSSGRGIAGMRARAELSGGTLTAGRGPHGRFAVDAVLPLPAAAAGRTPDALVGEAR